jgi:hypothetical protein
VGTNDNPDNVDAKAMACELGLGAEQVTYFIARDARLYGSISFDRVSTACRRFMRLVHQVLQAHQD